MWTEENRVRILNDDSDLSSLKRYGYEVAPFCSGKDMLRIVQDIIK